MLRSKILTTTLIMLFVFSFSKSWGQTTIFSENMGNANVGTLSIAANTFQNGTLTFSGTADTRTSTPSSGYAGASGVRNVFFNNTNFQIAGINTSACSSFTLTFGLNKPTTASNGSELTVEVSTDGATYSALGFAALPTGAGTTGWYLITINSGTIPSTGNLRIRFTGTGGIQFRLDDLVLKGNCSSCTPPSTTLTPTTQTVCAGSVTSFTVADDAAASPAPSYQWQMCATAGGTYSNVVDGTPAGTTYTGATTNSLSLTAGANYFYRCLVTDNSTTCTATSSTASLTVNTTPSITSQPASRTICTGSSTTFTIAASGSPLTYQWQYSSDAGATFTNVPVSVPHSNVTSATMNLTTPSTAFSGYVYRCIVSVAGCSSVTSNTVLLTVNQTPSAPPAPVPVANPACTTGTLAAASSTVAGVTWYWQGSVSTASVTTQSTATDYTFSTSNNYYVRALDASGTCWSSTSSVSVTVNTLPAITSQPSSRIICSNSNTTFTIAASGSPLTYQWQYSSDAGATFTNVPVSAPHSNVTSATMNLTTPSAAFNGYVYRCIVSVAGCASVTSNTVLLTVNQTPSAPPAPIPVANPACTTGTLAAASSTVAGVTWYWQGSVSTASVTTQSTATNYTFSTSNNYYVRALDASGTCWSSASSVSVTVNSPDLITSGASNSGICSETNTSFGVTGLAGATPKKWQVSTDNGVTFNDVSGAVYTNTTTSTLNLSNVPITFNGYQYQCVVSVPGCPVVTSTVGILTVTQTPSAPPTPTAITNPACSNTSLIAMTSTVSGQTWYWQGTNSAGTSTINPTSSSYAVSTSNTYYVRSRTDGSSCLSTSSSIAITINQPPTITSNPSDRIQCVGTNTTFAVSATGTGLSYQWQVNTGAGFSNLVNGAPYSNVTTATMSITSITSGMNGYQYQCVVSGASPCGSVTSTFGTLIITSSGEPTTAASSPVTDAVACNAFNLSWTSGNGSNRLVVVGTAAIAGSPTDGVSYTANTTFGSGSTIAAGEYVVYKGSGNSVFITGLGASTTYYYKIFEFNGCALDYLISGTVPNGNVTTTTCSSALGVTAIYIDACSGGCGYEGNNELIWCTSGSYGLKVNSNGPTLHYNSTSTPTTVMISTYTSNSTNITTLNSAVTSCTSTTFVDPNTLGYIPPNSNFLIANNCMCSPSAYDLSGLCDKGPIYVVFGTDATWPCNSTGGIFGNYNAGGGTRYFDLNFAAWGVSSSPLYNFNTTSLSNGGDGDVATFNPSGGAAVTYSNTTCTVPLLVLPIELLDFYGTQNGTKNDLIWKVAVEDNISNYIIEKSSDGVVFEELTRVIPKGTSQGYASYLTEDLSPNDEITYYRLTTVESEGELRRYKIIDLDRSNKEWRPLVYQMDHNLIVEFKNTLPKNSTISLYDLSGKLLADEVVKESQTKLEISDYATGLYFVKITTPYKTENFKIVIQK